MEPMPGVGQGLPGNLWLIHRAAVPGARAPLGLGAAVIFGRGLPRRFLGTGL